MWYRLMLVTLVFPAVLTAGDTWVGAFVYAHENDENIFVGALRFPAENLVLAKRLASFAGEVGDSFPRPL